MVSVCSQRNKRRGDGENGKNGIIQTNCKDLVFNCVPKFHIQIHSSDA